MEVSMVVLKSVAHAIKALDQSSFYKSNDSIGGRHNRLLYDEARRNLINILFSNGYELRYDTHRLIKSKYKRETI